MQHFKHCERNTEQIDLIIFTRQLKNYINEIRK